jgi:hypothetical protein
MHCRKSELNVPDCIKDLIGSSDQSVFMCENGARVDEYLFQPLHITDWMWETAKDGVTFGAFSLLTRG